MGEPRRGRLLTGKADSPSRFGSPTMRADASFWREPVHQCEIGRFQFGRVETGHREQALRGSRLFDWHMFRPEFIPVAAATSLLRSLLRSR